MAQGNIATGVEIAVRAGITPIVMGMRWSRGFARDRHHEAPELRPGWRLHTKRALDEFFLATEIASASMVSTRDRRRLIDEFEDAVSMYSARGWLDDPSGYHLEPEAPTHFSLGRRSTSLLEYRHLQFESGYEPHLGEPGRERWLDHQANRSAHAWLLEHPGPPRAWLVCVPGYRMGSPMADFVGFKPRWLHKTLGLNVAIPVLPLHGPRREGRRGGDGFLTGDFLDTIHAQSQAIWDIRKLLAHLREEREASRVGVYGVSLGGYTTALLAGHDDDLACAIAGAPATDFVRLLKRHIPSVAVRILQAAGISMTTLEEMMRVISPLHIEPRVARERRYLFAGNADSLVTPDHAVDLWNHWERPRIDWYHGSHVSFLWEPTVTGLVRDAVRESGLLAP